MWPSRKSISWTRAVERRKRKFKYTYSAWCAGRAAWFPAECSSGIRKWELQLLDINPGIRISSIYICICVIMIYDLEIFITINYMLTLHVNVLLISTHMYKFLSKGRVIHLQRMLSSCALLNLKGSKRFQALALTTADVDHLRSSQSSTLGVAQGRMSGSKQPAAYMEVSRFALEYFCNTQSSGKQAKCSISGRTVRIPSGVTTLGSPCMNPNKLFNASTWGSIWQRSYDTPSATD